MAAVGMRKQRGIFSGFLHMLLLQGSWRHVWFLRGHALLSSRHDGCSAGAAVVTHAIDGHVVDHRLVVRVVYHRHIGNVGHRTVIGERVADPASTGESHADVTEAVVDSTIEADVRAPVAGMKGIDTADKAPIAWGPQHSDAWRLVPRCRAPSSNRRRPRPNSRGSRDSRRQEWAAAHTSAAAAAPRSPESQPRGRARARHRPPEAAARTQEALRPAPMPRIRGCPALKVR